MVINAARIGCYLPARIGFNSEWSSQKGDNYAEVLRFQVRRNNLEAYSRQIYMGFDLVGLNTRSDVTDTVNEVTSLATFHA